ncbi:MAG TPA: HupE/UreJ family protein [Porticoccus sp.]|nr:HupE/UreJ family protein [Porticoccus sp.]
MRSKSLLPVLYVLANLLLGPAVFAHEGRPVYIEVQQAADGIYHLRWKTPPVIKSGSEPLVSLQGNHCQPLSAPVRPRLSGAKQYQCDRLDSGREGVNSTLGAAGANLEIVVQYPGNNPALSTLIKLTRLDGSVISLFNSPDQLRIRLPAQLSAWRVAWQYMIAGFEHILGGYDHLLFVLCLMHIAGGYRRIFITISGFTLAHSVTLALAALGVWRLRIDVVEVLIALSIVMLAAEIIKAKMTQQQVSLVWRYPAVVAVIFGLLHGFGFAGALGEMGLPDSMRISALAFFNIGVEIGQIVFAVVVVLVLMLLKNIVSAKSFDPHIDGDVNTHKAASAVSSDTVRLPVILIYGVGTISAYWFVQRAVVLFGQ